MLHRRLTSLFPGPCKPTPGRIPPCAFSTAACRDEVLVVAGPYKYMTGAVLAVFRDTRVPQVIVEGVNLVGASKPWVLRCME